MRNVLYALAVSFAFVLFVALGATPISAQQLEKKPAAGVSHPASDASRGAALAEGGHCNEALPLLRRAIHESADKDLHKRVGLDGLRCAMTHNVPFEALSFIEVLHRDFPDDPEVLYATTHAFSDLSVRTSQELMNVAPFSYQVRELDAESLETQGKWDEAAAEYRKVIEINPMLPGMHSRLGRALLSKPQPSDADAAQAKQAFEDELVINPNDATSEYVLGQLARNSGDFSGAIAHFTRATQIDASFSQAFLGLGEALVASKRFDDAIPPLERYEKMAPDSPTGHFQLALAYNGVGRRDDANREAGLQRQTSANLEAMKRKLAEGLLQQQSSGQTPQSGQPDATTPQPQSQPPAQQPQPQH